MTQEKKYFCPQTIRDKGGLNWEAGISDEITNFPFLFQRILILGS